MTTDVTPEQRDAWAGEHRVWCSYCCELPCKWDHTLYCVECGTPDPCPVVRMLAENADLRAALEAAEQLAKTMDHFADVAETCERKSNEHAAENLRLRDGITALADEWDATVYKLPPGHPMTVNEFCRHWFKGPLRALLNTPDADSTEAPARRLSVGGLTPTPDGGAA